MGGRGGGGGGEGAAGSVHSIIILHTPYIEDITRWCEDMSFIFEW